MSITDSRIQSSLKYRNIIKIISPKWLSVFPSMCCRRKQHNSNIKKNFFFILCFELHWTWFVILCLCLPKLLKGHVSRESILQITTYSIYLTLWWSPVWDRGKGYVPNLLFIFYYHFQTSNNLYTIGYKGL